MRKTFLVMVMVAALSLSMVGLALAGQPTEGNEANSLGKTTLDTEVSSWDVGSGQPNGEFVVAELQGVEIGLRAQERFVGPLDIAGTNGDRVGVYDAPIGVSEESSGTGNNARWNYDFHVDLSGATGNREGTTLDDYRLTLEQDFTEQSLFGVLGSDPVTLVGTLDGEFFAACGDAVQTETLCQQSWNPGFGNRSAREPDDGAAFDPTEARTYNLRLVLTPETFDGAPLAVAIQVEVTD